MRWSIFLTLVLCFSPLAGYAAGENTSVARGELDRNLLARLVVEETNRFRMSQGREALTMCPPLNMAAQGHAQAMAEEKFFAHRNPNDAGQRTLTDRIRGVGLETKAYAENIALTYSVDFRDMQAWSKSRHQTPAPAALEYTYRALAKSVVQQWVNSRGHRQNMLGRPYSQIGLGFATAQDSRGFERVYCVQTFCAPI
ncbi:MAG: CAP domain-containing protein [Chthoniobacterales bacterium]